MNSNPRILLIEQDKEFRNLIVPHLRSSFVVLMANDAVEALSIAVVHKPEAIVVDLKLEGGMSGIQLIKAVRDNITLHSIPLLALSDDANKASVISVVEAGANDFLIKTSTCSETLHQKLCRLLNVRNGRQKTTLNTENDTPTRADAFKSLSAENNTSNNAGVPYDPRIELPAGTTSRMLHLTGMTDGDSKSLKDGEDQSIENRINPFIKHTSIVFNKLLNWNLKRTSIVTKNSYVPSHEVSSVITMKGPYSGTIVLSLSREVAFTLVQAISDSKVSQINEDVIDTVAELTNIIAGRASADLTRHETRIGLPTVMVGHTKVAPFPHGSIPLCVSFVSEGGPLTLEVGFESPPPVKTPKKTTPKPDDKDESAEKQSDTTKNPDAPTPEKTDTQQAEIEEPVLEPPVTEKNHTPYETTENKMLEPTPEEPALK